MGRWSHLPLGVRILVWTIRPLFLVLTKRDWRGFEKLPKDSGYVIAPNHVSHLDPFFFAHALVEHGITPRFLGKDTVWNYPVLGWIVKHAEQIPVYRGTQGAAESLRAAVASVEQGRPVIIYPEGTITRDPQMWPMTGRTGAVRVALTTGKPLFPLMQWGPNEILPPYTRIPMILPRKTMHVWVGDALDLSEFVGRELTEELLHTATDQLMDAITAMQADLRRTRPVGPRVEVRSLGPAGTNYSGPEGTDG
jgi:1-acyl-sn-glycerol-3-phosphate acyltransferase